MTRHLTILLALAAQTAAAQATVSGIVRDSLSRTPIAGAAVQLAGPEGESARTTTSDSLGRYSFAQVSDGRYMLGFFHPTLDSLGVEPAAREIIVANHKAVRTDLSTPSPAALRAAICNVKPGADSGAIVLGVVRDGHTGTPISGAHVTGDWLEISFTANGLVRRVPQLTATTRENGWFALCNVPNSGTMFLAASRGADTTAVIELQIPKDGFARRELYIAGRENTGRLSGAVVAVSGNSGIAGAQVSIPGGATTLTNERGEWALDGVPLGTRMVEVRAINFYPQRRAVDVVDGSRPVRFALSTMKAVLDTVKITAARSYDRNSSGFNDRRRSGIGYYITPENILRRNPIVVSDMLRNTPGIQLMRGRFGDIVTMRGTFTDRCLPGFFIDGHYMNDLSTEELDMWAHPDEIAGIEIYSGTGVPAQFNTGLLGVGHSAKNPMDQCGSIVVWTRPRLGNKRVFTMGNLLKVGTAVGLGYALQAYIFAKR